MSYLKSNCGGETVNINRGIKITIVVLLVGTVSTLAYLLHNYQRPATNQSEKFGAQTSKEKQQEINSWAENKWSFSNAEEASRKLPFKFKMPDEKLTGKPTGYYVTISNEINAREFFVLYANGVNGIILSAHIKPIQPDYTDIDQVNYWGLDKTPSILDRNGIQYYTVEPGYNSTSEKKPPRPGVVRWWKDDVLYELYGTKGPKVTSVDELIATAESLNNSNVSYYSGETIIESEGTTDK